MFLKLVKMLALHIKINFNQRYIFFPRNKVKVVLKLALLASHVAETLIENIRKTKTKPRPQTLHVAWYNMCYVFHVVFIKHIKWCILLHKVVQRNIHQIPMIISKM